MTGTDLAGNTYWYFKPSFASPRPRRILQNNPKIAYSDLNISRTHFFPFDATHI